MYVGLRLRYLDAGRFHMKQLIMLLKKDVTSYGATYMHIYLVINFYTTLISIAIPTKITHFFDNSNKNYSCSHLNFEFLSFRNTPKKKK